LQGVSASDEPVGSLMVAMDDEVCAQHMAHAWGEKRGRKPFVSVELSQGTRETPEADAETDATRRLASLDAGDVAVTKHIIPRFAMGRLLLHQRRLPGKAMQQVTVHTYRQDTY
jgi:hypothetical protein